MSTVMNLPVPWKGGISWLSERLSASEEAPYSMPNLSQTTDELRLW